MTAKHLAAAVYLVALACAGCNTSANIPPPPQVKIAQTIKLVADSDVAAVKIIISLRDAGKISQGTANIVENWLALVANNDKAISAILASTDTWQVQKTKILILLAATTAPQVATTIDPAGAVAIAQVVTLLAQIQAQVGSSITPQ